MIFAMHICSAQLHTICFDICLCRLSEQEED